MANRFWVKVAGGTWDNADTTNWSTTTGGGSGASVPGAADTAIFDNNSGSGTITTNYSPSITAITLDNTNLFAGTLKLGAALTLSGSLTIGSGTFQSQGNTITASVVTCMAISTTRALDITNSTVNITGTGTAWQTGSVTGLTFTGTGSTINFNAVTASARTMGMGNGNTFGNISVSAGTGTFATANATATVTGNLNFTGYTGNWLNGVSFNLGGNLTLGSGMAFTDGTAVITMNGSGTQTITTNGNTGMRAITVNNSGTVTLADDLVINSARALTVTAGTFTGNGKNILVGTFSSSNSNVRTINVSGSRLEANGTGSAFNLATTSNLTWTPPASLILSDISATAKSYFVGSLSYNDVTIMGGAGQIVYTGDNTCVNFYVYAPANILMNFGGSSTRTITGTFRVFNAGPSAFVTMAPSAGTWTFTKASGAVLLDYVNFTGGIATGGAQFYAGSHSVDGGSNVGWIFGAFSPSPSASVSASISPSASRSPSASTSPSASASASLSPSASRSPSASASLSLSPSSSVSASLSPSSSASSSASASVSPSHSASASPSQEIFGPTVNLTVLRQTANLSIKKVEANIRIVD